MTLRRRTNCWWESHPLGKRLQLIVRPTEKPVTLGNRPPLLIRPTSHRCWKLQSCSKSWSSPDTQPAKPSCQRSGLDPYHKAHVVWRWCYLSHTVLVLSSSKNRKKEKTCDGVYINICLIFTRMPSESYRRQRWSLLYLCDVFRALIENASLLEFSYIVFTLMSEKNYHRRLGLCCRAFNLWWMPLFVDSPLRWTFVERFISRWTLSALQ